MKRVVAFVVDKRLDLKNHIIALDAYARNVRAGTQSRNEKNEKLLKLSLPKRKAAITKEIDWYYTNKRKFLDALAKDVNASWLPIESDFIQRIERVHQRPFAFRSIRGVLSSASKFGYESGVWFATSMFRNKFAAMDTAMHEMMHFMFHKYYQETCVKRGLTGDQIWDIKESFTVLLNFEFDDFRFDEDFGYSQHKKIREAIKKSWMKNQDFAKALEAAIMVVH